MWSDPMLQHPIPVQGCLNRWLHPSKPQGEAGLLNKTGDFRYLGRTLRVHEVDTFAVEHDPVEHDPVEPAP
jgi:hypothetical protein